jgi:tetratricopeptide (TPR) repeat protein
MDLKAARCPSCGGDLDIPNGVDFVECPYCGVDVKVRDIVSHELDNKTVIELAGHAYNSGNYSSALEYYDFVLEKEPTNSFALLGKIKSTIEKDWEDGPRKTSGVKEFIIACLAKVEENKKQLYLDNIVELVCGIYDDEFKKYKDDLELIAKSSEYRDQLLYLLETAYELNPSSIIIISRLLDYCLVMQRLNITAVGNVMNGKRLDALFKKYTEALAALDFVKSQEYLNKWSAKVSEQKTRTSNVRRGCVMLIFTIGVILLAIWAIMKFT